MMSLKDTFEYVIEVPVGGRAALPWRAGLLTPVGLKKRRLVGSAPLLDLADFDERLGVQRTRIILTASDPADATKREAAFTIDRGFANMLKPHDQLYVAMNCYGGLGVSVLRQGLLVGAAGSVSSVPLGNSVSVRRPGPLAHQAETIFRATDPEYEMWECPVEITIDGTTRFLHRGIPTLGRYALFVVHGFVLGVECLAITLPRVCPDCAATLTAPVLDKGDALKTRPFGDPILECETKVLMAIEAARLHLEAGDLDAAESSALEALVFDFNSDHAKALLEEIEKRRRR